MKRVILLAVIQAVVLFFIGALAYAFKGDFFLQLSSSCLCAYLQSVPVLLGLCYGDCALPKRQLRLLKVLRKRLRIIRESDDVFIGFLSVRS